MTSLNISPGRLEDRINALFLLDVPEILAKYNVLPIFAERALAPISPPSCGICSIINSWAIDSIANPHLNDDLGAIIALLGETSGLALTGSAMIGYTLPILREYLYGISSWLFFLVSE